MTSAADDDAQDLAWLAQAAGGGAPAEAAMRMLFAKYYRRLVATAIRKFCLQQAVAEELVQQALVRAFQAAAAPDRACCEVFTCLYRSVVARCLDHRHGPRRGKSVDDEERGRAASTSVQAGLRTDAACAQRRFEQRFAGFADRYPRHAEALAQVYFQQATVRDAAAAHGRSAEAMRQFFVECRSRLREFLEPHGLPSEPRG